MEAPARARYGDLPVAGAIGRGRVMDQDVVPGLGLARVRDVSLRRDLVLRAAGDVDARGAVGALDPADLFACRVHELDRDRGRRCEPRGRAVGPLGDECGDREVGIRDGQLECLRGAVLDRGGVRDRTVRQREAQVVPVRGNGCGGGLLLDGREAHARNGEKDDAYDGRDMVRFHADNPFPNKRHPVRTRGNNPS